MGWFGTGGSDQRPSASVLVVRIMVCQSEATSITSAFPRGESIGSATVPLRDLENCTLAITVVSTPAKHGNNNRIARPTNSAALLGEK
jgi:hypothetical protein